MAGPGELNGGDPHADDAQRVHAFITLTIEEARAKAREIDRKIAAGEDAGPLAGVPFTVKDIFTVQNTPSTAGSRILANFIAPYTASAVERIQAAGAVMLGKTNLDEFTYGSSNESTAFQPCPRNPWHLERVREVPPAAAPRLSPQEKAASRSGPIRPAPSASRPRFAGWSG